MEATIGTDRPFAPKADTKAGVSATSIWTKIKAAAKAVARTVAKPFAFIGRKAKALGAAVAPRSQKFWTLALRPLLKLTLFVLSVGLLSIGLVVYPIQVAVGMLALGLVCLGLAEGLEALEKRGSRRALQILEGVAHVMIVLGYITAVGALVAVAVAAWPFAVVLVLAGVLRSLWLRDVGNINNIDFTVDINVGDVGFDADAARASVAEPVAVEPFLQAEGSEELHGTTHDVDPCANEECSAPQGAMRTDGFCGACYDQRGEEDAVNYTGVSLKARRVEFRLNFNGLSHTPEWVASKANPSKVVWVTSGWFRTRDGVEYEREWSLLDDGDVVAMVHYDHRRRVYRASALSKFLMTARNLSEAMDAARDEVDTARRLVLEDVAAADLAETLGILFSVPSKASQEG